MRQLPGRSHADEASRDRGRRANRYLSCRRDCLSSGHGRCRRFRRRSGSCRTPLL